MKLRYEGVLASECSLPGETHAEDVYAAHPNGAQLSRDRWLITYATRGMDGWDTDRSAVYQLRAGAPDGPVIKEGMLSAGIYDWDPLGDGRRTFKQHGHPVVFGVPKGALIDGKPVPHDNLFVAKWRIVALGIDPQTGRLFNDDELHYATQGTEWMQFRLNDAEDDIEVVAPPAPLRQKGYETGPAHNERNTLVNASFVQAVPFNADGSEWVECNDFKRFGPAVFKYRYHPQRKLYEWVEVGPLLFDWSDGKQMIEGSLSRRKDEWIVGARLYERGLPRGMVWLRTDDPFASRGKTVIADVPAASAPRTTYVCGDGVLRVFTGDPTASPYGDNANPLYCWDVDPDNGFATTNRQPIFDVREAGIFAGQPKLDMCKLLSPQGNTQTIIYRVAPRFPIPAGSSLDYSNAWKYLDPKKDFNSGFTPEQKAKFGIYHSKLVYEREAAFAWRFS